MRYLRNSASATASSTFWCAVTIKEVQLGVAFPVGRTGIHLSGNLQERRLLLHLSSKYQATALQLWSAILVASRTTATAADLGHARQSSNHCQAEKQPCCTAEYTADNLCHRVVPCDLSALSSPGGRQESPARKGRPLCPTPTELSSRAWWFFLSNCGPLCSSSP